MAASCPPTCRAYTGRLAISTGSQTEDIGINFEIKPGYNTQVVRLKGDKPSTEHFYVQVIGENFDGNPSFASPGAGPGKLQRKLFIVNIGRPSNKWMPAQRYSL